MVWISVYGSAIHLWQAGANHI